MKRALALMVAALAMTFWARAYSVEPAATQPTAANIDALIQQLSSEQWRARQQAQERLGEMGDAVVPRLTALARESNDEEVRSRAEAALKQIEANNKTAPTLITLHLKDAPLAAILAEVSRQAKAEIVLWPPLNNQPDQTKLTIDVDRQPFWTVMKEICTQAKCSPWPMGQGREITLQRNMDGFGKAPFCQYQCFFVSVESATRSHTVDYANPQRVQNNFAVQMKVLADPKLRVLQGPGSLKLEEAVDDNANSLIPPGSPYEGYSNQGHWIWTMGTPLQYQPNLGKKISVLRAKARFVVLEKSETWEIADVLNAKNQEKKIGAETKYTFKGLSKVGENQYQAQIVIVNTGKAVQGRNLHNDAGMVQRNLRLVDAQGRSFTNSGYGGGGGFAQLTYSYTFYANDGRGQNPGEPVKLIWEIPLETKEIIVPIEFKDLPLP